MSNNVLNQDNMISNEIKVLTSLYFIIALAEIIAEYFALDNFIYIFKPLLLPILGFMYWKSSLVKNPYFFIALFFNFLANIFFISQSFDSILIASIFYLFYRITAIYLVLKIINSNNYLPVILGCIPFITVFGYSTCLTYENIESGFYIYLLQIILMVFLGGYSLANYVVNSNKKNYWLLMSSVMFAIIQFIYILKLYYFSIVIFQPIAMLLFVMAHYAFYKFLLLSEEINLDDDALSI